MKNRPRFFCVAGNDAVAQPADPVDAHFYDVARLHGMDVCGVPVLLTSPGSSVNAAEMYAIKVGMLKA